MAKKNEFIDLAQARPERKVVENPLTWWGDTPWLLWNWNYGAAPARDGGTVRHLRGGRAGTAAARARGRARSGPLATEC